ncbi:MAG TPA: hypothetical protein VHG09_06275, partial [Longimicrobiales bacterium]|nr:hypothetical protein [Longimicrobiales bacterium]
MMRAVRAAGAAVLLAACAQGSPDADPGVADTLARSPGADSLATVPDAGASHARDEWPDAGPVEYRRQRAVDLTGDGVSETAIAAARGPTFDSLDISITIVDEARDTLWHEAWPSLLYFKYDPLEGKADSTVRRIVGDHVEQLIDTDRFTMDGGLPPALSQGGDPAAIMREAIHYHLAELDWRRAAGLSPAEPTPVDAYSEISTDSIPPQRVAAVMEDVRDSPSFMYYAGGEATYAIA